MGMPAIGKTAGQLVLSVRPRRVSVRSVRSSQSVKNGEYGETLKSPATMIGPSMLARRSASGPGLVGAYFGVDPGWTGLDLCDGASPLRLEDDPDGRGARMSIDARPRVGIDYAGPGWVDRPWRFSIRAHPAVSRAR
jgi:3-methyladenine DNA glycosylase Mpg